MSARGASERGRGPGEEAGLKGANMVAEPALEGRGCLSRVGEERWRGYVSRLCPP